MLLDRNSDMGPPTTPSSNCAPCANRFSVDAYTPPLRCEASCEDAVSDTQTPTEDHDDVAADASTWGYCTMRGFYLSEMNQHLEQLVDAKLADDKRAAALQRVAQAARDYSWCYDRVAPELPPSPPNDRYRPTSPLRSISHKDLHDRVCKAVQDIWEVAHHAPTTTAIAGGPVADLVVPLVVSRAGCLQSLDAEYQWRMYGEDASLDAALEGTIRKLHITCCNNFAGLCTGDRFRTRLMQSSHL
ncbi:hypothetical protein K4K49_009806 [Colletotrichum sp. SAR 10_70]|nr:hypothetical protein K4K50_010293 [Colletotrichum sp. SAR 10_71]KAI8154196.1 hypothetical protein K4K49_009806 [Colletotrichum sp. SAR 10_70]KAI8156225.1 hypothetical protein KHU50_009921 [Colletotrichum sp. SAR 10_65]KAI8216371.1 hypothetical protein K4K53_010177 [Colletotrichum sp. SAR 10_77]